MIASFSSVSVRPFCWARPKAYALRSRLIHGAAHATDQSDVDPVADLLRRALTQALAADRRGEPFGTSHFWKNLQLR